MDDPGLDVEEHCGALAGLARLNHWSASTRNVWLPIAELARENGRRQIRVLDIGSGAGDIPLGLWRKGRRAGLPLDVHGIDVSPKAVLYARSRAEACGASVKFYEHDALSNELPAGFDVVTSSLFLHHLDRERAIALLQSMARSWRSLVVVNDLARCARGLILAHVAARALTRSPVVRVDAPRSVRAAFTRSEVRGLASQAGLDGARVIRRWPCRLLLIWKRPA
jgi:2-polyprenyl-3-methyl-5-hydroxy-6-metoxy-1,4-benzoquinol methylase